MYDIWIYGCDFAWVFHGDVDHEPIPVVVKNCNRVNIPNRNVTYSVAAFNIETLDDKPCM